MRRLDQSFEQVGAAAHRYALNAPLTEREVSAFESLHGISLPEEYRRFVIEIGDGGAGPMYGLYRLDRSDLPEFADDDRAVGFLAESFPHSKAWNPALADPSYDEDDYFDPRHIAGSFTLGHAGCGYLVRLVLTGEQRGTVWEDGRPSDMGVYPIAAGFASWYLRWLAPADSR